MYNGSRCHHLWLTVLVLTLYFLSKWQCRQDVETDEILRLLSFLSILHRCLSIFLEFFVAFFFFESLKAMVNWHGSNNNCGLVGWPPSPGFWNRFLLFCKFLVFRWLLIAVTCLFYRFFLPTFFGLIVFCLFGFLGALATWRLIYLVLLWLLYKTNCKPIFDGLSWGGGRAGW